MGALRFDWDEKKNRANIRKHGVSFPEARSAFHDDSALVFFDPDHSSGEEERFLLLGMSVALRMLVVCHCFRESDLVVRIISARKATRAEAKAYRERQS